MGAFAVARIEIPVTEGSRLQQTSGETDSVAAAVERVAAFVPIEILTLYLAVLALVDSSATGPQWAITAICALLAPAAIFVAHLERARTTNEDLKKSGKPPRTFSTPSWPMVASVISFGLWVLVLPGSVAASLDVYSRRGALIVLLLGEFAIALFDRYLKTKGD